MTRTRKSARRRRIAERRLRFEALEERTLLAIAAFHVNLYEDAGGVPGRLVSNDTVAVGDTFFLEVTAQEFHPLAGGLAGISLDLAWDPQILREIDLPFYPSQVITRDLPLFNTGTLDNEAGGIQNLSGGAFLSSDVGRAIGNLGPERFCLLHFQALEPANEMEFRMRQGGSRIVTVPVATLRTSQLDFEPQTITVVAHAAADQVQTVSVASEPEETVDGMLSLIAPIETTEIAGSPAAAAAPVDDPVTSAANSVTWRNPSNPNDVDGRNGVTALDVLITINYINVHPGDLAVPSVNVVPPPFYDVTGDNLITARDAVVVINYLSDGIRPLAEGEAAEALQPAAAMADNGPPVALASSVAAGVAGTDEAPAGPTGMAVFDPAVAGATAVPDAFDPPSQPRQRTSAEQGLLWSSDSADSTAMVTGSAKCLRLDSALADAVFAKALTGRATARTAPSTALLADDVEAAIDAVTDGWLVNEV